MSMPSNIAEGHARYSTKDFARFISIARGSLAELETQLELLFRLNIVDAEPFALAMASYDELGRILRGIRKSPDAKLAATFR
jgi:four helix bundle protein